jgi:hypothetical protein
MAGRAGEFLLRMRLQVPENSSVRGGEGEGIQFCQRLPDTVISGGASSASP